MFRTICTSPFLVRYHLSLCIYHFHTIWDEYILPLWHMASVMLVCGLLKVANIKKLCPHWLNYSHMQAAIPISPWFPIMTSTIAQNTILFRAKRNPLLSVRRVFCCHQTSVMANYSWYLLLFTYFFVCLSVCLPACMPGSSWVQEYALKPVGWMMCFLRTTLVLICILNVSSYMYHVF